MKDGECNAHQEGLWQSTAARVRPAWEMSLEVALEYIQEDELVEITPSNIRIRKRLLLESDRRRATRRAKD